jgi:hypothetical protein
MPGREVAVVELGDDGSDVEGYSALGSCDNEASSHSIKLKAATKA